MRKIASHNLAQLLMQLRFTPEKKRRKQLEAAEKLFAVVDPEREYPFEFVFFRITGFNLKSPDGGELIQGDQLLEDLRVFVSKLGGKLARPLAEQTETIYTVAELAERIGVSAKTISRWRTRGLVPRKYIFPDGVRRLGFLQSKVDEFVDGNPGLVARASGFDRLTDSQKQQIVRQAAKLSAEKNLSRQQIIGKIAARTGRCPETIRYTLRDYENAYPGKVEIKKSGGAIEPAQAAEIYRLYKQGCSVKELMRRFDRRKSTIYRIINRRRAKSLRAKKVEFVASKEFLEEGAEQRILTESAHPDGTDKNRTAQPFELADSHVLPEYLQVLADTPVLGREQEVELFRRYNFLKFMACRLRNDLRGTNISGTKLRLVEDYLAQAEETKRRLIEANLRLVVRIASRHVGTGADFSELVSKGNFALVNAVEEFDYAKGLRFSKLASLSIAKEYAKLSGKGTRLPRERSDSVREVMRALRDKSAADPAHTEAGTRNLFEAIRNELDDREQHVILNRFGLLGTPIRKQIKTLKQIGDELGLSKERVRQIELIALQKLRQSLSIEEFELLTG